MKRLTILSALALFWSAISMAAKPGFAIVIDPASYHQAVEQVGAYAAQLEKEGLGVHILIDKWGVPDSIRTALIQLHTDKRHPIEGAVLIGDIPVAMIRDAQHMTSAFKMNQQTFERFESSVPSDRFYDSFDLDFSFIGRDDDTPCFYYSLTASSAQRLRPSIYSGRIRPTDAGGTSRYEKLRKYLDKTVREKQSHNALDQILYFSGNGFISESMVARIDEKATLYEHFPWLRQQRGGIGYIDHKRDTYVKFRLMNEMQRPDLDLAILHHHGDWNIQYMNNLPTFNQPKEQIDAVRLYLRESLRHAREHGRELDSIRVKLMDKFDVPTNWFDRSFDSLTMVKDSIHLYDLDLYLDDFRIYEPNCRFVVLDACFNGSFHRDNCIANEYIFGDGATVAVMANSVNVLQDKWVDRYLGLSGMGMYVGNLVKYGPFLETHIIGDPTFCFARQTAMPDAGAALRSCSTSLWQKHLEDDRYPALQSLAMEQLFRMGKLTSAQLLVMFKSSPSHVVRMQALINLSEIKDDNFIACLGLAVDDSYEMVSRIAMNMINFSGDERLVATLVRASIANNTSERIEFSVTQAIPMYPKSKLMAEFDRQFPQMNYMDSDKVQRQIATVFERYAGKWDKDIDQIISSDTSASKRLMNIRTLRNYHVHYRVADLLEYLQLSQDNQVIIALLEALGWFDMSVKAPDIARIAMRMSKDTNYSKEVRDEAMKTYKRLTE